MEKNKLLLFAALLILVVSFSSCGIFSKGCGCPTFGKIKQAPSPQVFTMTLEKITPLQNLTLYPQISTNLIWI
jgi:hypothetical protein